MKMQSFKKIQSLVHGRFHEVLGLRVVKQERSGAIRAEFVVKKKHTQPWDHLHGGVSAGVAENLAGLATTCLLEGGEAALGVDLHISHLRAVPIGEKVTVQVNPVKLGSRLHFWSIDFFNSKKEMVARSSHTILISKLSK